MIDRMVALLLAVGMFAGCSPSGASSEQDRLHGLAVASVALAEAMGGDDTDPRPGPEPDDGKCDTCGGRGWYRPDGSVRVDCPNCDANTLGTDTGLSPDRLRFITRENCPPCEAWKRQVLPVLERRGWEIGDTIEIVVTTDPLRSTPSFEWLDSNNNSLGSAWKGYTDRERFLDRLRRAMGKR